MATVFAGQKIRIKLETDVTLTGMTCRIKYKKPDGTTGYFSATIDPSDASKMYYDAPATDTNYIGWWIFWAYYYNSTVVGIGEIVRQYFTEESKMRSDY
jgi:hypothetical protein